MVASTGVTALNGDWLNLPLFFAQQPEPDLEFTEEDLDEAAPPPPPMRAPKRSGKKPLLWIVVLLVLGGIGYAAYDMDGMMQLLAPYLGDGSEPTAQAPHMPAAPQVKPQAPSTTAPPAPATMATPAPATPAPAPAASVAAPMAPIAQVAGPAFSEGQRVTVISDPARPQATVPLFLNAAGTKTAMTVPASATLTVLDGEFQNNGWVYAVRTEDGRKGWIAERSLKLKR